MGFAMLVTWACGALYLASLAADFEGVSSSGLVSFLSPSTPSLFLFGASGAVPVFRFGRWWTVLSAGWLHAGVLHILFNMLWAHLGGLGGGYLAANLLDPLQPERGNHVLVAAGCLVLSLLSIAVSVVRGLEILR